MSSPMNLALVEPSVTDIKAIEVIKYLRHSLDRLQYPFTERHRVDTTFTKKYAHTLRTQGIYFA